MTGELPTEWIGDHEWKKTPNKESLWECERCNCAVFVDRFHPKFFNHDDTNYNYRSCDESIMEQALE